MADPEGRRAARMNLPVQRVVDQRLREREQQRILEALEQARGRPTLVERATQPQNRATTLGPQQARISPGQQANRLQQSGTTSGQQAIVQAPPQEIRNRSSSGTTPGQVLPRVDPEIDRLVERGIQPHPGPNPPTGPPTGGHVDSQRIARQRHIEQQIVARQRFLQDLTRRLQETAPHALTSPGLVENRAELRRAENEFRQLMQRNPRGLSAADRRRALEIFDRAYSRTRWDEARPAFWRALYNHPEGRRLIDLGRRSGGISLSDADIRRGRAPRILDFDNQGRRIYRVIDIDHAIPRERVPFYAYRPDNLHLQTDAFNRRWLNPYSRATPFPMGRYGQSDDVEEFVQANQLSRRQRPLRERVRRGARRVGNAAVAALLATLFAAGRAEVYAQTAERMRATRRQRESESRSSSPIGPNGVGTDNIRNLIQRVFGHHPLEVSQERAGEFNQAVQNWLMHDYQPGGDGMSSFFRERFDLGVRNNDPAILFDLLDHVGREGEIERLRELPSNLMRLEDARELVENLLEDGEEYLVRAEAAEELSNAPRDVFQMEMEAYPIIMDDAVTIIDHYRHNAGFYRNYVNYLSDTVAAINEALSVERSRSRQLIEAIERVYERRAEQGL